MTRYISLAQYLWLAEQVTGLAAKDLSITGRIELADSALHAPKPASTIKTSTPTSTTKPPSCAGDSLETIPYPMATNEPHRHRSSSSTTSTTDNGQWTPDPPDIDDTEQAMRER